MSSIKKLDDLHTTLDALYEKERSGFQALLAREGTIRAELDKIDQMMKGSSARTGEPDAMKQIGADVLWQGWAGRAKDDLNVALAQILAQKEHQLARLRQAYGKVLVTRQMITNSVKNAKQQRIRKELDQIVGMVSTTGLQPYQ